MSAIAGVAIGCDAGHAPRTAYAMWLRWSAESRCCPSQQLGKRTCSRRLSARVLGHVGTSLDEGTVLAAPQFQYVICIPCGDVACRSPAIILKPAGNTRTGASVLRR